MQCQNYIASPAAFCLEAEIKRVRCARAASKRVHINPPKEHDDGTKCVCDFCAKWDWSGFRQTDLT